MAEQSEISWTDATFNPWIGCTKISPACDRCYAARDNERRKWVAAWGEVGAPPSPRKRTSVANWRNPIRWNKKAAESGVPLRVFCASLADVFDNEVEQAWRDDLWDLIRATPHLRWILLTKRIGNAPKMLPDDWQQNDRFSHVGLMATLENQEVWDRDYRKLMAVPAAWRGVSAEPLLGPIDMQPMMFHHGKIDWMITGGESGPGFRPLDMNAVRVIRNQCAVAGVTFHHKQNGGITGKVAGCLVDGAEHKNFPPALAA
jgi:protein gp37